VYVSAIYVPKSQLAQLPTHANNKGLIEHKIVLDYFFAR